MKKMISLMLSLLLWGSVLTGCAGKDESFMKKSYTAKEEISEICIDVRDRQVEVTQSTDEQIHIYYYENNKEYYNISVSDDNILTMTAINDKEWTDFIGKKPSLEVRKILLQVPDALLENLKISTTNEAISIASLTLTGDVLLSTNGGNISFDALKVEKEITLDVKNGNISGVISGSYDEYAISCSVKKGESNLPSQKNTGNKKLSVTANNGDVMIDIHL